MLDHLDEVIDIVSGGEKHYRFNERQLFYAPAAHRHDGDRAGTEDRQLHKHHHRLRGRERRDSDSCIASRAVRSPTRIRARRSRSAP